MNEIIVSEDSHKLLHRRPGIKTNLKTTEEPIFKAPEGYWTRCPDCSAILQTALVSSNHEVCTECQHHFRLGSQERIKFLVDEGSFKEINSDLAPKDFLNFFDTKSYTDRIQSSQKKTSMKDAFLCGSAKLDGRAIWVGAFEFSYMGGSMGSVVGEKITRLFEKALEKKQPVVIFQASGGARMQEGLTSLMQMAKTLTLVSKLNEAGVPYVSILTDPTTGGVAASFALMGDVNIAEPNALVGFAGPRVIEQTLNEKLPKNFQRSEFLLEHGMIDKIVPRKELRQTLSRYFKLLSPKG